MKVLERRRERKESERRAADNARREKQRAAEERAEAAAIEHVLSLSDAQLEKYIAHKSEMRIKYAFDSEVMHLYHVEMVAGLKEQQRRAAVSLGDGPTEGAQPS